MGIATPIGTSLGGAIGRSSGGNPGGPTAASLLGSTLVAQWDVRSGVSAAAFTWTDTVGARVLTGVGSPSFGTDGSNFRGLPVWKMLAASTQQMDGTFATAIANGSTGLYVSLVYRSTTLPGGSNYRFVELLDSGLSAEIAQIKFTTAANMVGSIVFGIGDSPSDTATHTFEIWIEPGTGDIVQSLDYGTTVHPGVTGIVTGGNFQRVTLNGFPSPQVELGDVAYACLRVCNVKPSDAIRAQLHALDTSSFGVP